MRKINYYLIYPAIILLIWEAVKLLFFSDSMLLPSPIETIACLFELFYSGSIFGDLFSSLYKVVIVFLISCLIGIPLGLFLGGKEKFYRRIEFIIDFFRSTPATALFPLFLLFFGISDFSKIASAAFGAFLIILFNTSYGVINSKKTRVLAAKLAGANKTQIFTKITFWESLPQTFVGLRNAISISLVIIIVLEMFIGSNFGLGKRIIDAQQVFNITEMYAVIIVVGILGYFLNYLLILVEKKYVHWSEK